MPSAKTECSELSVAFGLLKLNPLTTPFEAINISFKGSLPFSKYQRFVKEYKREPETYYRLIRVGEILRLKYLPFQTLKEVEWTGPTKLASTTSLVKDLKAGPVPVSVKLESNVVTNYSPFNLFVKVPEGSVKSHGEKNWFLHLEPDTYQTLYSFVRKRGAIHLPEKIEDFERLATRGERKLLKSLIAEFDSSEHEVFYAIYRNMNHGVAEKSARIFNDSLSKSLASTSRSAVLESIIKSFFRLNAVEYILCGIDKRQDFAVVVPELSKWKSNWRISKLIAQPDTARKQSVVTFLIEFQTKGSKKTYSYRFHAEIRWSHGKFSGNPEAKLYKDFSWKEIRFLQQIL